MATGILIKTIGKQMTQTEDPDQQSLANQMRVFQKSMLENQRTFQVTMTDTITEKINQMFSQLNRSTFVDNC